MITIEKNNIDKTIERLHRDSKNDPFKMMKGISKGLFRPLQPSDFKEAYLSISKRQGEEITQLIIENGFQNIVEFGTSFGISTLYLAKGVIETSGTIITTELIESKAAKAKQNFEEAGVSELIEIKVGDALDTLKNYEQPIDLLVLDGWKDLYLPLFLMLEPNFQKHTLIYVDNADMAGTRAFLKAIAAQSRYTIVYKHQGKVAYITAKS